MSIEIKKISLTYVRLSYVNAQTHLNTRKSYATLVFSIIKKSRKNDVIAFKKQILNNCKKQRNHNIRTVNVWHHCALTRLRKRTATYKKLEKSKEALNYLKHSISFLWLSWEFRNQIYRYSTNSDCDSFSFYRQAQAVLRLI